MPRLIVRQSAPRRVNRAFFVNSKLELNRATPRNQHVFDDPSSRPNCFGTYIQKSGRLTREEWIAKYGSDEGFTAYSGGLAEFAAVRTGRDFGAIDRNHDHKLSRDEWIAMYGSDVGFDAYDLDGDGFVDEHEFARGQTAKQQFRNATSSSAGRMSREQWIAMHGSAEGFDAYDLSGSGFISEADFIQGKAIANEFDAVDANHDQKLNREEWIAKYGSAEGFDAYDLNGDGFVDKAEFMHGEKSKQLFKQMDQNNDKKLSREEWVAKFGTDAGFEAYDLNGDGLIDADEFVRAMGAKREFTQLDTNHDNKLSLEEWKAKYGTEEGFEAYDLDGNGLIDPDEFIQAKVARAVFKRADANNDKKLSKEEWVALHGSEDGFAFYDLNGDGYVDEAEFARGKAMQREFSKADFDGDKKLSRMEWIKKYGSVAGFDAYDLDGDGFITESEFAAGKAAKREFTQMTLRQNGVGGKKNITRDEWIARYGSANGFNEYDMNNDGIIDEHEFIAQRGKEIHQKFDFGDGSRQICHNYTKEPEYVGGRSTHVIGKVNRQQAYGTDSANAAQDLLKMWSHRVSDPNQFGHLGKGYQKAVGVPTIRLANRKEPKFKYEDTYRMKPIMK